MSVSVGQKSDQQIGLSIGDSFAEVSISGKAKASHRWFLPRKNLSEGLKEFLQGKLAEGGVLHVLTANVEKDLRKRTGSPPAFLVTAGFEHWLQQTLPLSSHQASLQPRRNWSPLEDDRIFGISERTLSSGKTETVVSIEELGFLPSKLELLKIKNVAIGFLHASQNPANEKAAAQFFREKGFDVVCSHEMNASSSETSRWWLAILEAYVRPPFLEHLQSLHAALGEHKDKWTVKISGVPENSLSALGTYWARKTILQKTRKTSATTLHFGLDHFFLIKEGQSETWQTEFGEINNPLANCCELSLQPTSRIGLSFWPTPSAKQEASGYEPGPMFLGKSQQLTVLDVLFVRDHLRLPEPLNAMAAEKSKSRILETLFTMAKSLPKLSPSESEQVAADVEKNIIEFLNIDLHKHQVSGTLSVSGAFAETFVPLLALRRPDLKFVIESDAANWESLSLLHEAQA